MESSLATIGHQMKSRNCKEEVGTESRVENVIRTCGAVVGHRNSCRCNFEAMSEVSVTDCDRHTIHTYI